jgi:hypothetical protein
VTATEIKAHAPWLAGLDPSAPDFSGWDAYAAWERWMVRHIDDALPEVYGSFMDAADETHKAYLYNLMSRLAVGDPTLAEVPR